MKITCISNNGAGPSEFSIRHIELHGSSVRMLSEQVPALNFRLRSSDASYSSEWHVAGDPTMLVILKGTICIELRSGENRDFSAGEMFIAQDYLPNKIPFNNETHGHRAYVKGNDELSVLHLKLARQKTA